VRLLLACFLFGWALPLVAQDDLPAGKGKETLENTCTECHGLDKVLSALRSRERWRTIAAEMRSKGATMSDAEMDTLVEYLSQYFGTVENAPQKSKTIDKITIDKINVNRATAKELETVLQLTPGEAAAVVRYREAKGPFKAWRDLTRVRGLDKAKIAAKRDQLSF
jgi:competence ComEA-like helix-hairpin-helix protein